MEILNVFLYLVIVAGIGWWIGSRKGRGRLGATLSVILGPLGWLVILMWKKSGKSAVEEQSSTIEPSENPFAS